MKNKALYILYSLLLVLAQLGIINEMREYSVTHIGYGFYINNLFLFLYFAIEFIIFSFIIAFRAEYYFRKDGIMILARYRSRTKMYFFVLMDAFLHLSIFKLMTYMFYGGFVFLFFKNIIFSKLIIAFLFDLLVSAILFTGQINLEIKHNAKISLLITNAAYLACIALGGVLYNTVQTNHGAAVTVCNFINILPNYLYLERIEMLGVSFLITFTLLLLILILYILISTATIKKIDIIEEEN